jgi:hypothetical protein
MSRRDRREMMHAPEPRRFRKRVGRMTLHVVDGDRGERDFFVDKQTALAWAKRPSIQGGYRRYVGTKILWTEASKWKTRDRDALLTARAYHTRNRKRRQKILRLRRSR